jgi:phage terminase large subunit-like protein
VPHSPWRRQRAFLLLDSAEAFYGGAAAGGKSEALLMAALQYVDVPGYAALILRRDIRRLTLAGGLIPRSQLWLAGQPGVSWNGTERRWTFETGGAPATLTFGYLQDSSDKYRYGSTEFQYIAFDELTEFPEDDYLFLFSRLRRTTDIAVPLRMRSASNPGNLGHAWVKQRFIADCELLIADWGTETPSSNPRPAVSFNQQSAIPNQQSPLVLWRDGRAYVPARIADNPAVDEAEYRATLAHLPPVERARLMEGDWNVNAAGLVRPHWLRYFEEVGSALVFVDKLGIAGGQGSRGAEEKDPPTTAPTLRLSPAPPHPCSPAVFPAACRRFVTVDPAGTSSERAAESRGRPASWSVVQVWDQPLGELREHLLLRHVARARVGFDGLVRLLREVHAQWRPARMLIENEKLGQAAVDVLGRELPLVTIGTQGRDKVARAAPLLVKLEQGRLWLPRSAPWLADFENELLSWTGLPEETADQIDAAAYAVREAEEYWGEGRIERVFGA